MPEKEFEIYLSLLSRLLRLNAAQKASISDELRDHLEERLSELLQAGVLREKAIEIAMGEFGDVTGLALDLTKVSRTPLRKVVMRSTIAASAVAALIVGWVTLFVPEHRVAAPPSVQAQQGQPKSEISPAAVIEAAAPLNLPLLATNDAELFPPFLATRKDVDFAETPLTDVCQSLTTTFEVPVVYHRLGLSEANISPDVPVNLKVDELTFEEVLNHISRQLGLTWRVDEGIVQFTTDASPHYLTRYHDLHKLTKLGHSLNSLVSLVRLQASDWENNGGDATTALIGESLVVRQTYQHQRQIAMVLAAVELQQPMTYLDTCTNRDRLSRALKEPSSVDFSETPLAEALKSLADTHEIPILIDVTALADANITPETPITLTLKDRPLGKLLDLLFDEMALTYQVRDGVIRVTTTAAVDQDLTLVVYNVVGISTDEEFPSHLSEAIQRTTNGKWEQRDGEGGALAQTGSLFLVRQSDRVHAEIQAILKHLRSSGNGGKIVEPGAAPHRPKMITKSYRMPKEIAMDLQTAIPNLVSPSGWSLTNGELPVIELVSSRPQMETVEGLVSGGSHEIRIVNQSVEVPKDTKKPDAAATPAPSSVKSIVVRPRSTLVIRQTPEMHREIQKFLKNLDVVVESGMPQNGEFIGGGFMGGGGMGGMGGGGVGGGGFF